MYDCICGKSFKSLKGLHCHQCHCKLIIGEEKYIQECKRKSEAFTGRTIVHKGNTEKRIPKELLDQYLKDGWLFGLSDTHKELDSKSLSGSCNPMYNKHHSDETRKKISDKLSDGRMLGLNNPMYGVDRSGESHCCYGRIKIYKDDVNSTCYPEEFEELEKQGWKRGVCKRTRIKTSQETLKAFATYGRLQEADARVSWKSSYFRDKYLRSSYEAIYVVYCIYKNINFEFADHMKLSLMEGSNYKYVYHPDFYLPDSNTIVEVNNGINKDLLLKREFVTKNYGYNWELILGDKINEYYNELSNNDVNIRELWLKLQESKPGNRIHWNFIDNKIIFIEGG